MGPAWSSHQYRLVHLAVALDESGAWALDGAATAAHWLADALDVEVCTAREWVRVGRALAGLPLIDAAFGVGALSFSKVRALTRVATPAEEAELCDLAERVPAGHIGRAIAAWRAQREDADEVERRQHADRSFTTRVDNDGMVCGSFRLPPLEGGTVVAMVEAHLMRMRPDATAVASGGDSLSRQRADAFLAVVANGGGRVRTEVVLHVRADGCSLDDGTPIAGSVVERIAPSSFLRALIHDAEARPVDASCARRHPPHARSGWSVSAIVCVATAGRQPSRSTTTCRRTRSLAAPEPTSSSSAARPATGAVTRRRETRRSGSPDPVHG